MLRPHDEPPRTPWRDWAIFWFTTAVTAAVTGLATKGAEAVVEELRERRKKARESKDPPR